MAAPAPLFRARKKKKRLGMTTCHPV
ncbi:hypothetical protein L195_g025435, partial [Trifolium pratense]